MTDRSLEVRLASRPAGEPEAANFDVVETDMPSAGEGQALVRNVYMSVDPYMRGRMRDIQSYTPPFQIGKVLDGGAVGVVEESNSDALAPGDLVSSRFGWRSHFAAPAAELQKIDTHGAPLSAFLGVLGMPGMTAYVGLLDIGEPKEGETVFVSAAAGAVGSLVGQIAKIKGCRAVGSAGSADKVAHLVSDLGYDAAFDYHGDLNRNLADTCPDGIDVYFENVGGPTLEAVFLHMNMFGRIPVCGMIAHYNDKEPRPGPKTLISIIPKRLKMQGFIVSDHMDRRADFVRDVAGWIAEGKVTYRETIVSGLENAPEAFMGLFRGANTGKMVVQISDDPTK